MLIIEFLLNIKQQDALHDDQSKIFI